MKKILNYILSALFLIWELPQNIIGVIVLYIYATFSDVIVVDEGASVSVHTSIKGGLSVGAFNYPTRGY